MLQIQRPNPQELIPVLHWCLGFLTVTRSKEKGRKDSLSGKLSFPWLFHIALSDTCISVADPGISMLVHLHMLQHI